MAQTRIELLRRLVVTTPLCLALLTLPAAVQRSLQTLTGLVRDRTGAPLAGAEVLLGDRRSLTNLQGAFRVDSLRAGQYSITIRLPGYSPVRSIVVVSAAQETRVEYVLARGPLVLPTLVANAQRAGIFGAVGDSAYHPLAGAKVQMEGSEGGEALTDSLGRFAFPVAHGGQYMIRTTLPGFAERWVMVELKRGEGREVAVRLMPSNGAPARIGEVGLADLGERLKYGLPRERLTAEQLVRNGSMSLCDVPRIQAEIGRSRDARMLFILNGIHADTMADLSFVCAWRADEVELVEFGADTCKDVTGSFFRAAGTWCSGRTRNVRRSSTRSIAQGLGGMSGGRVAGQPSGMRYVIIWEKK